MPRAFRRVVTGHNAQGRADLHLGRPGAGRVSTAGRRDRRHRALGDQRDARQQRRQRRSDGRPAAAPAAAEERLEIPRGRVSAGFASGSRRLRALGSHANAKSEGYVRDLANKRHPGFHKTDTIDYAIVLSGEIYALMDEGEVLLKTGDVLIQRGTNHAWSNRTEQPCCIAFVLIDAEPV